MSREVMTRTYDHFILLDTYLKLNNNNKTRNNVITNINVYINIYRREKRIYKYINANINNKTITSKRGINMTINVVLCEWRINYRNIIIHDDDEL